MLVAIVQWQSTGADATISIDVTGAGDSGSMTLIAGSKATFGSPTNMQQIAFFPALAAGGTKTVTVTFSALCYATMGVMEYAGQDPASQPDASNSATGSASDSSLSLTTIANNALIVAMSSNNNQEPTAGSSYTLWGTRPNNAGYEEDEDNVDAGIAGSKTVNFVHGGFGGWALIAASFKIAGGGAANWGRLLGMETNRLVRVVG
jgi:hypothetical protein